jgi:hypothetical protein
MGDQRIVLRQRIADLREHVERRGDVPDVLTVDDAKPVLVEAT